ncbi:MAG: Gfo/Idh/MocA family oxidoreductase [Thermoguttaceae bacterium]
MNPVTVIGCGYWGKNLVRVFSELGALRGVCDAEATRLKALRFQGAPPRFCESLDEVLADPQTRAVAIATPAATHYEIVLACLKAGKDVFVEKPLALNAEQGRSLVELAEQRGLILMVGHILLYHPAVRRLRQLIDEGQLGRVLYLYSNRLNMGLIRTEENILWSFAPHDISVMLHLLGEEPIAAEAEGQSYLTPGVVDVTLSRLWFKSGVTGHIFVSWLHPVKEQRLVVVGTEKMAVFDDVASQKLLLYPHRVDWPGRVPKAVKAEPIPVEIDQVEPLKQQCQHFLDCVAQRQRPLSDGREGLRVLRVLDLCQRSLERALPARPVPAPPSAAPAGAASARDYYVHPSAYVDEPCWIGPGTKIWHFSHVMKGARVGANCVIGQNVLVASTAVIGDGVKIQNNVSIYDGVVLEDGVFCGPSVVFTNVVNPRSEIVRKAEYRPTLVKRGATLGANSTILCGHTIGEYAFVAAGAVVTRDVPAFALVAGVPARQIGWICRCAAQRLQFDGQGQSHCSVCGRSYFQLEGEVREVCPVGPAAPAAGEP